MLPRIPRSSIAAGLTGAATTALIAALGVVAFQAVTVGAVDPEESTFVPISPCRLFDTRPGEFNVGARSSPLGPDESHDFGVTGTNGDCTIPAAATAVSINLTGVAPTAATNLRMYPAGEPVPTAAALNMTAGQAPTPNKLDVKLSPGGEVAVYNRFGTVHVVGDVMGYYRHDGLGELEQRLAELESTRPFVVEATSDQVVALPTTPVETLAVAITAPTAGHVTVHSTVNAVHSASGSVVCGIFPSDAIPGALLLTDESVHAFDGDNDTFGTVGGVRVFDVTAGEQLAISQACEETGANAGIASARHLVATFTPGP